MAFPSTPPKALVLALCKDHRRIALYNWFCIHMSSETMHQIVEIVEAGVRSRPSAIEFEMAYQARVAIDRIRFAIKHVERFVAPCVQMRDANLQLLDALDRLEALDRRFQIRSRIIAGQNASIEGTGN